MKEEKVELFGKTVSLKDNSFGRIIRGKSLDDFGTLTDDPLRKLVMVMGYDELRKIAGKTGRQALVEIGYTASYIDRKVSEGNQFKLVIFSDNMNAFRLANWDGVIEAVSKVYPDVKEYLYRSQRFLERVSFLELEKMAGFKFSEVDAVGSSNKKFMTLERFLRSDGGLVDTRAFLYFTIHLREFFSGDGYTYNERGERCLKEYIGRNVLVSTLSRCKVINIEI